jgi:hypothetical protein
MDKPSQILPKETKGLFVLRSDAYTLVTRNGYRVDDATMNLMMYGNHGGHICNPRGWFKYGYLYTTTNASMEVAPGRKLGNPTRCLNRALTISLPPLSLNKIKNAVSQYGSIYVQILVRIMIYVYVYINTLSFLSCWMLLTYN